MSRRRSRSASLASSTRRSSSCSSDSYSLRDCAPPFVLRRLDSTYVPIAMIGVSSMKSAYCGLPVMPIMTTAMTSGPTVDATLKCALGGSLGLRGTSICAGAGAPIGRGGRLWGTVPPGPTWRRRSRLCGRSSSVTGRTVSANAPTSTTSPGATLTGVPVSIGRPSTNVPFSEPRSVIVALPSGASSRTQCSRDTVRSGSSIVVARVRPIVLRPASSASARPTSRPARITSSKPDLRG